MSHSHCHRGFLIESIDRALDDEEHIAGIMERYRDNHLGLARHLIEDEKALAQVDKVLAPGFRQLERLLYGLSFTREATPRLYDSIVSLGEQSCARLLAAVMANRKVIAVAAMPQELGLVTDGKFGDATVNLKVTRNNFTEHLRPRMKADTIVFMPGFYGISPHGDITTFGRGGSDYAAAVAAAGLDAERLEIWKDVDGFMSADPRMVPESQLIPELSYEEAAELAYFGAKILHPRTMEPVRLGKIPVAIRNTVDPDARGTRIRAKSPQPASVIKSVAYDTSIGLLKIYASGVGARMGILAQVATAMTEKGINIRSVVTSQTCISLLLAESDLDAGRQALMAMQPRPFRRIEKVTDAALISIVGEGLSRKKGIAARCFSAVAGCDVNVDMIAFGPSRAALYFLARQSSLQRAVVAIHSTFFSTPRCSP